MAMTINDEDAVTWGDVKNPILQNTLSSIVINIIRKCLLTYSPVIAVALTLIGWYFTGLSGSIEKIGDTQLEIIKTQVKQTEEIKSISRSMK